MKDVLKMVRFDFILAGSLSVSYVLAFMGLCLVNALFGVPLGVFCFAVPMMIFGPAREACGAEQRRIYGILPVQKSAVTRAAFWENTVMLLAGEVFSMLFLLISDNAELYRIFPESFGEMLNYLKSENNLSLDGLYAAIIFISSYLGVLSAYLEMEAEIHGRESDIKNITVALAATAAAGAVTTVLIKKVYCRPLENGVCRGRRRGKSCLRLWQTQQP